MQRSELCDYLNDYLRIDQIQDYGPQGLQVEGREGVNKIVGMVDAHLPCVEAALTREADMLLVHHGIFWGTAKPIVGQFANLIRLILSTELNLYAAHLPLDSHAEVGNNAELARRLGLEVESHWGNVKGTDIGVLAIDPGGNKLDYLVDRYEQTVGPVRLVQANGPRVVHRVGILCGYGIEFIEEAAKLGCDTFLTGETSHAKYYDSLNMGMNVIYGGHYVSETVGVQALGRHLEEKFGVEFEFVDMPTGM